MTELPLNDTGLTSGGFRKLFLDEFPGLVLFAIRFVKDRETAKDIVHEAFTALWERRHTIEPGRPPAPWLMTTIRNKCLNHLRDNQKFHPNLAALEGFEADNIPLADNPLILKEIQTRITQTKQNLPEKCREVYELNRTHHLKYQQIADKLGISVKTVEAQMTKALKAFRENLKEFLGLFILIMWK